jgi:hypothetical protein
MDGDSLEELQLRVRRIEDDSTITKLVRSYGPAADAGKEMCIGGVVELKAAGRSCHS